jgi:hypothetical protein
MEYVGSVLNFAWAARCVAAFTWFMVLACVQRTPSRKAVLFRALALGLALVSLFPCVSASDDSVRLILLNQQIAPDSPGQMSWSGHHTSTEVLAILAGMLEVLENAQISAIVAICVSLSLFAFALAVQAESLDRFLPSCAGRAPPRIPAASL